MQELIWLVGFFLQELFLVRNFLPWSQLNPLMMLLIDIDLGFIDVCVYGLR